MKRNKIRKSKLTHELINVRGKKEYVTYCNSHPIHTFIEDGLYFGLKRYRGYINYDTNPEFKGYFVLDIYNRENRLFATFKKKRLYLINKSNDITWSEWLKFNDFSNNSKYKIHLKNYNIPFDN